jgi:hypothetical protein
MRKPLSLLLAVFLATAVAATPVLAQDWRRHEDRADWRWHGDIHHFHDYDFEYWRGGHWIHDFHEGRYGWWWVAGGFWYFYPAPVYPYPDPFVPTGVTVEIVPSGATAYYYCDNPAGYYPYVPQCLAAWRRVVEVTASAPVVVPQQQVIVTQPPHPTPAPVPVPVAGSRDEDYRQLNILADEFYHTDLNAPNAIGKLKALGKRVESFRKSLYKRNYNAMEVLRDSEDLKDRITAKRKELAEHKMVPPASLPSGSTVVFPAH